MSLFVLYSALSLFYLKSYGHGKFESSIHQGLERSELQVSLPSLTYKGQTLESRKVLYSFLSQEMFRNRRRRNSTGYWGDIFVPNRPGNT